MLEPWITILAAVVILGYARLGMTFGLFCELPNSCMLFVAMLISLRYWYPMTGMFQSVMGTGSTTAVVAFWALLIFVCSPMILLLRRVTEDSRPVYPAKLDLGLGLLLGGCSATIFFCCVMLSASIFVPKLWPGYDPQTMYVQWDKLPIRVFQYFESNWLNIPPDDPSHTRFLSTERTEDSAATWR